MDRSRIYLNYLGIAVVITAAILVVSCKSKMAQAEALNLKDTPVQTIDDMFAVQTKNGLVVMRVESSVMERYQNDSSSYESFPKGIHITNKNRSTRQQEEIWEAFGNVVIHNVLKQETMETDTLYWNQAKNEIYTDCYVKMYSPQGFLQGYGMRSDDHARNAILLEPFNGYGYTVKDSTVVVIDSVNFIGPLVKNLR